MKPAKIDLGWETQLPVMERAFRSMGMFDAAERARRKFDATEAAVAAGVDSILDCEWYDRGVSQMPGMFQEERGGDVIAYFGPISVALQRDQMGILWALLSIALFPQWSDLAAATRGLASSCYDECGDLHTGFFPTEEIP